MAIFFVALFADNACFADMSRIQTRECPRCNGSGKEVDPLALAADFMERRKKLGLSLRAVAERMEFTAQYISDLERGRRWINAEIRQKFEDALAAK